MKKYLWLAYPAGVGVFILISLIVLFGSMNLWQKITQSGWQLEQQLETAARLREKLIRLQAADETTENQNLNYLLSVMPATKNLPGLLAQVDQAAVGAGAVFESFRGAVGEVTASESAVASEGGLDLEVVLGVASLDQLEQVLGALEKSLPLISVKQVKFGPGRAEIIVSAAWQPLSRLQAGPKYAVPDTSSGLDQIRSRLAEYTTLPPADPTVVITETGVNENPF